MRMLLTVLVASAALPVAVAGAAVNATVVVDLDPALGELPEGVAVDKRGDVFFSVSPLGQIRKLDRAVLRALREESERLAAFHA